MANPPSDALTGKVVLVTGAAKRIGRDIAMRLAREGATVAIHYNTSRDEAERTAEECGAAGIFQANLESVDDIRRMFDQVHERLGHLDGLVNNAARFTQKDPLDITEADWDFIHSVNLKAVFFCCQSAARIMRQNDGHGRIVNISSLGGLRPWSQHAHYCASKAGVIMLTKALAKAFAPMITVNSVAPGVIPFGGTDERIDKLICATPARRAGTGDEIADGVLFFLGASNFVTGQILAIDGGLSLK
jgi:NAD(P)-dependent dehydrogenase (short-subunit alcohol dehydrogenase family)